MSLVLFAVILIIRFQSQLPLATYIFKLMDYFLLQTVAEFEVVTRSWSQFHCLKHLILTWYWELDRMMYACNPALERQRQEDHHEFEASQGSNK